MLQEAPREHSHRPWLRPGKVWPPPPYSSPVGPKPLLGWWPMWDRRGSLGALPGSSPLTAKGPDCLYFAV